MLTDLKPLFLVLMAFGLMLGLLSRKKVFKAIGRMIFLPMLFWVLFNYINRFYNNLNTFPQVLFLVVFSILILVAILRLTLGKTVFTDVLGNFIYDLLKAFFLLPFRLMTKLFNLFSQKNR